MNEDDLYYALSLFLDSGFQILGKPWKILFCGRSRRSVSIPRQINAFANLTWHLPLGLFKFMKPVWIGSLDPWYKVIQHSQSVFLFFFSTKDRGCRIVAALLLIGPKSLLCMVQFDLIPCPQGITPGICNFFFLVVYSPPSGTQRERQLPTPELLMDIIYAFPGYFFLRAKLISVQYWEKRARIQDFYERWVELI